MRKAEKFVSQEEMWSKLAKHSKSSVAVATAQPEPLVWLEPVKTGRRSGYVLTACGGFSISKDDCGTSVGYTAWDRRVVPPAMAINLGCVATKEEAEMLCEAAR